MQQTLASQASFEKYGRKTRRELFLEEMNQVVPWSELEALVEPHYPKAGNGRRPVGLGIMLRTYFVQQWFNLSDPGVEEALYDFTSLRRFVGVDLGVAPAPDETSVCRFRHLLEKHELGEAMLDAVNHHLGSKGIRITTGTIVDATIIHAQQERRSPELPLSYALKHRPERITKCAPEPLKCPVSAKLKCPNYPSEGTFRGFGRATYGGLDRSNVGSAPGRHRGC
jgi:hypothetical protein